MSGRFRLFMDEITSVGFVDDGAAEDANIVFWKKAATPGGEAATVPDETTASAASAEPSKEKQMAGLDLSALPEDLAKTVSDHVAELEARAADLEAKVAELTPDPEPEDVAKAADPAVQELLAKQADQIAALEKQAAEDAARLNAEIAKARAVDFEKRAERFTELLGKPADVAPVLDALEAAAPADYAKFEKMLDAAAELPAIADLFKERGQSGAGEVDYEGAKRAYIAKQREAGSDKSDAELAGEFAKTGQARELAKAERS